MLNKPHESTCSIDGENPYTDEWLHTYAVKSLRRIEATSWDYSDSLLLYVGGSDEKYGEIQNTDTPYRRLVTEPENIYLGGRHYHFLHDRRPLQTRGR